MVAFDAISGSIIQTGDNSGVNKTTTITLSASATIAVAFIEASLSAGQSDANITWPPGTLTLGGQAMTRVTNAIDHAGAGSPPGSGTTGFCDMFYLLNPPTGLQTLSLTVSYTGTGNTLNTLAFCTSYTGALKSGAELGTAKRNNGSGVPSLTLTDTLATGDLFVGCAVNGTAAPTVTTGTSRGTATGDTSTASHGGIRVGDNTGTGSINLVFGTNSGDNSASCAVRLTAATTGDTGYSQKDARPPGHLSPTSIPRRPWPVIIDTTPPAVWLPQLPQPASRRPPLILRTNMPSPIPVGPDTPMPRPRVARRLVWRAVGRQAAPPAAQPAAPVNPAFATTGIQHRLYIALTRRWRAPSPVPPQFNPPYPFRVQDLARTRRGWPVRRGTAANPPIPQTSPIPSLRPALRFRGWITRRGRAPMPTPPQFNPPYPVRGQPPVRQWRGLVTKVRRRPQPTPDQAMLPGQPPRRPYRSVRVVGRRATVPPPQVTPPVSPLVFKATAVRVVRGVLGRRRGGGLQPVPPQFNPPLPLRLPGQAKAFRGVPIRRGSRATPVPPQVNPLLPMKRPDLRRAIRGWPVRRGSLRVPVRGQVNPPMPLRPQTMRRALRGWITRRGRRIGPWLPQSIATFVGAIRAWASISEVIKGEADIGAVVAAWAEVKPDIVGTVTLDSVVRADVAITEVIEGEADA